MLFSTTYSAPLHASFQTKATQKYSLSPLWPSMALSVPSAKLSIGSSKSAFFRSGFFLQSSNFPGIFVKSRFSGVYARAATDKTLYDFSVKVQACSFHPFSFFTLLFDFFCAIFCFFL